MFTFKKNYFLFAILLLVTEIIIAVFVHDKIIRPYGGDFLMVILVYCFVRAFTTISVNAAALFTLLFSFTVELLQYAGIVQKAGLQDSPIARTVIGSSFEWADLALYTAGVLLVLLIEKQIASKQKK